jgi:hypothetical protein
MGGMGGGDLICSQTQAQVTLIPTRK